MPRSSGFDRLRCAVLVVAALAAAGVAIAQAPPGGGPGVAESPVHAVDAGTYRVFQDSTFVGVEHFSFETRHDSAMVFSHVRQLLPRPRALPDTLRKDAAEVRSAGFGTLRYYESEQSLNRHRLARRLEIGDTTYQSYRQSDRENTADTEELPPGRIYVVDPQVFALFELICRDMLAQKVDERPITMLYLLPRDTTVEAHIRKLGRESVRVEGLTYPCEKLGITDPFSQFYAWMTPHGRMLRFTLPKVGLRVERSPADLAKLEPPPPSVPGRRRAAHPLRSGAPRPRRRATAR